MDRRLPAIGQYDSRILSLSLLPSQLDGNLVSGTTPAIILEPLTILQQKQSSDSMVGQSPHPTSTVVELIEESGDPTDSVPVTVGPRFLELFSENLYGSPNKAFEELVANSWDADAQSIFVHIPEDLEDPAASIWVLDNGSSMDLQGLQRLWAVAQSNKRDSMNAKRPQIGKFGIGKLATYILANEITYICKGPDGVIRAVTMDYRRVEEGDATALHQQAISLQVRPIDDHTLETIARGFTGGDYFLTLVDQNLPMPQSAEVFTDDFGGITPEEPPLTSNTWTLALLSSLKDEGRSIQRGRVRWMLRTALPLNASVGIALNKEALIPSKVNKPIEHEWVLGEGLDLDAIDVGDSTIAAVTEEKKPSPSLFVEGIEGPITGRFRLYSDRISGGKSDALGASNGFFVNVKGRVINYSAPDFGLDNLSHGPWSQFRATIRCDSLDAILNVDRNGLREGTELDTFRAVLRAFFNKARQKHTSLESANWPSAGDILTGSWNIIPLQSLGTVVAERLHAGSSLPSVFDAADVTDFEATLSEWEELRSERQGELIADIAHEEMDPKHPAVRYDLANHRFLINSAHPFVRQHSTTHEEQLLIREMLLVTFLSDARLLDLGLNDGIYEDVGRYRDELLRLMSQLNRKTGPEIADLLLRSTTVRRLGNCCRGSASVPWVRCSGAWGKRRTRWHFAGAALQRLIRLVPFVLFRVRYQVQTQLIRPNNQQSGFKQRRWSGANCTPP